MLFEELVALADRLRVLAHELASLTLEAREERARLRSLVGRRIRALHRAERTLIHPLLGGRPGADRVIEEWRWHQRRLEAALEALERVDPGDRHFQTVAEILRARVDAYAAEERQELLQRATALLHEKEGRLVAAAVHRAAAIEG